MKVQRPVSNDVDGGNILETVRIYFYVLIDPFTDKIRYVGQTVDPGNRFRNHIYEAKQNNRNHKERWVMQLIRKNAKPIMKVLWEEILTKEDANSFETYMIDFYKQEGHDLTNEEDRARNNPVIETIPIYQFDLQGNFIARYPNANQARLHTDVNDAAIGEMCRFPFKPGNNSRGGFLWAYTDTPSKEYQDPKGTPKKTVQYDKTGSKFIAEYASAREASKVTGVCYKRISACITGRQNTAGGFVWKLNEDMV
jgi:hypothetical protein